MEEGESNWGWRKVEPLSMVLRGEGGSLTLVVEAVLDGEVPDDGYSALGITAQVELDSRLGSDFHVTTTHALYESLERWYDELTRLRQGDLSEVVLTMMGLELKIYQFSSGTHSGLCVMGQISDVWERDDFPWPSSDIGHRLTQRREPAVHLRFGFLTHLVDPPDLDHFRRDILDAWRHLVLR